MSDEETSGGLINHHLQHDIDDDGLYLSILFDDDLCFITYIPYIHSVVLQVNVSVAVARTLFAAMLVN